MVAAGVSNMDALGRAAVAAVPHPASSIRFGARPMIVKEESTVGCAACAKASLCNEAAALADV